MLNAQVNDAGNQSGGTDTVTFVFHLKLRDPSKNYPPTLPLFSISAYIPSGTELGKTVVIPQTIMPFPYHPDGKPINFEEVDV